MTRMAYSMLTMLTLGVVCTACISVPPPPPSGIGPDTERVAPAKFEVLDVFYAESIAGALILKDPQGAIRSLATLPKWAQGQSAVTANPTSLSRTISIDEKMSVDVGLSLWFKNFGLDLAASFKIKDVKSVQITLTGEFEQDFSDLEAMPLILEQGKQWTTDEWRLALKRDLVTKCYGVKSMRVSFVGIADQSLKLDATLLKQIGYTSDQKYYRKTDVALDITAVTYIGYMSMPLREVIPNDRIPNAAQVARADATGLVADFGSTPPFEVGELGNQTALLPAARNLLTDGRAYPAKNDNGKPYLAEAVAWWADSAPEARSAKSVTASVALVFDQPQSLQGVTLTFLVSSYFQLVAPTSVQVVLYNKGGRVLTEATLTEETYTKGDSSIIVGTKNLKADSVHRLVVSITLSEEQVKALPHGKAGVALTELAVE